MVRHEAAEALGSIASDSTESLLKEFQSDPEPVVSESCDVALDLAEYWTSQEVRFVLGVYDFCRALRLN